MEETYKQHSPRSTRNVKKGIENCRYKNATACLCGTGKTNSGVWDSYLANGINKLEEVQNKALR